MNSSLEIMEALADSRLLSSEHHATIFRDMLPRCSEWNVLAAEIIYRGWLTPFQMQAVLAGKGAELIVGSYVTDQPIADGASSRIFRARNWKLGTLVALKIIRAEHINDRTALARFLREIRALGSVQHPYLVRAFDADKADHRYYVAMEYMPGGDLSQLLDRRGPLPIETACLYASQVASALAHISMLGLVHRDVKPSNILVAEDEKSIKLTDLGLARNESSSDSSHQITNVGVMIGTPDYVAPEQIRNPRSADVRADLYSLGCTLYQLLTGTPPFGNRSAVDKLFHQLNVEPKPINEIRYDLPDRLVRIVHRLLAKKARDRFQDPIEVCKLLRQFTGSTGDTLADAIAPTTPDSPIPTLLPRTAEYPLSELKILSAPPRAETNQLPNLRLAQSLPVVRPLFIFMIIVLLIYLGATLFDSNWLEFREWIINQK